MELSVGEEVSLLLGVKSNHFIHEQVNGLIEVSHSVKLCAVCFSILYISDRGNINRTVNQCIYSKCFDCALHFSHTYTFFLDKAESEATLELSVILYYIRKYFTLTPKYGQGWMKNLVSKVVYLQHIFWVMV